MNPITMEAASAMLGHAPMQRFHDAVMNQWKAEWPAMRTSMHRRQMRNALEMYAGPLGRECVLAKLGVDPSGDVLGQLRHRFRCSLSHKRAKHWCFSAAIHAALWQAMVCEKFLTKRGQV